MSATGQPALRVLHVESGIGFGGSIISLAELVKGLLEVGGVESIILTSQSRELTEGLFPLSEVIHWSRVLSYRTRYAFMAFLARCGLRGWLAVLPQRLYVVADLFHGYYTSVKISRLVLRRQIDVVHVNNGWDLSVIRGGSWGGARCVAHFRGFPGPHSTSTRQRYGRAIDDVVVRYVGISESVSESIRAFGAPEEKIRTIHNSVSWEEYMRAGARRDEVREKYSVPPDRVVAAVFGRITPWKGQVEFLESVVEIVDQCENLVIMFVGDESDAEDRYYSERLRKISSSAALAGRVILTGYQKDVAACYGAADIVVHCSVEPEPFGRVVIEGMASGRAVIAMDEGGPPDVITHGHDGLLVPPRDAEALGAALLRLYRDAALRERLGRNGLDTVQRDFSPRGIALQVAECLRASPVA